MTTSRRPKIFPHLWYAKDAEAAATLYASIFPDSQVDRVTSLLSESPSGPSGSVKIVDFTLMGQRFQAMNAGIGELAVELFNNDIDHTTALSMFQWLRDEAHNLDDDHLHELHGNNAKTVQSRIQSDHEAIYSTQYQEPIRTESEWGAGRIVIVVIGVILALLRASNGCKSSSTYEPPSYTAPKRFDLDPEMYRDLLRNYEHRLPERTYESLESLEGFGREPSLEHESRP